MSVKNDKAKLAVIVVHEIYGVNQHMEGICRLLLEYGFDVFCPNLIGQKTAFGYSQEELAYQNFMGNVGFATASLQVKNLVSEITADYQKVFIVGFSVGATVSWLCSEAKGVHGIVGYYGSRIRDYTEVTPKCPVLLFFPQEEQAFNVNQVISVMDKTNTAIHNFTGQHGFSDPYSPKYNEESANQAFNKMVTFLQQHSST